MTRKSLIDINNIKTSSIIPKISFNNLIERNFDIFDEFFNDFHEFSWKKTSLPYNTILIDDTSYRIEIALAGYNKNNISIFTENNSVVIEAFSYKREDKAEHEPEGEVENNEKLVSDVSSNQLNIKAYPHYLHKGISNKYAKLKFGIPKHGVVQTAIFDNGILSIDIVVDPPKSLRQEISIK
jgi:HSP20 family molecular chaperone IbpA